ncbi:putative cation-transporting ATPase 1 [Sorochytrium milnesiophthora]
MPCGDAANHKTSPEGRNMTTIPSRSKTIEEPGKSLRRHGAKAHVQSVAGTTRFGAASGENVEPKKALNEIADRPWIAQLLPQVFVWTRVSPVQKEFIITTKKSSGYTTPMCGDGTNDVGALKQSHIGVALLDGTVEDLAKIAKHHRYLRMKQMYEQQTQLMMEEERAAKRGEKLAVVAEAPKPDLQNMTPLQRRQLAAQQKQALSEEMAAKLMNTLGDIDDEVPTLKLGDASIAAFFTSKLSCLTSETNIIKQCRCTLVTTIQMYNILALNSLISAYSMSVLYLEGMKWGDWQMTIQGFMIALCFFFISHGQPLDKRSKARPQPNISNFYILLSVIGQFVIHSASLVYITTTAKEHTGELEVDYDGKKTFEPNVLNAGVYLLSTSMQVSTLRENSALFKGLAAVGLMSFVAALELSPELDNWLQLIELPENVFEKSTTVMVDNLGLLRVSLARLPPKLTEHVLAHAGIEAVAVIRQLNALRRLLESYTRGTNRSTRIEAIIVNACIRARWSAGLQTVYDYALDGIAESPQIFSLPMHGLLLQPDTVDQIARRGGHWHSKVAAQLTYNLVAAGYDVWQMAARHCHQNHRFAMALAGELIERGGNIDKLRTLWQKCDMYEGDYYLTHAFIKTAAECNNMTLLIDLDKACPDLAYEQALHTEVAYTNNLEVVQYLYGRAYNKNLECAISYAMADLALDTVMWLLDQQDPAEPRIHVDAAEVAKGGHLPLLQRLWVEQDGVQNQVGELACKAATGNHIHILDWLYSVNPVAFTQGEFSSNSFHGTLKHVNQATVEWLVARTDCAPTPTTLTAVCRVGRLDCARWMWSTFPATRSVDAVLTCLYAVGGLELAQCMASQLSVPEQQQLRGDERLITGLASCAHERALRWLHDQHPIVVTATDLQHAALAGNLNLGQWLYSLSPDAMDAASILNTASTQSNLAMVQWVVSLLPPDCSPHDALLEAAANGRLDNIRWIHQHCAPGYSTPAMMVAASYGHLSIVQFFHEQGVEGFTTDAMDSAAKRGDLELVMWLHERRPEGCTTDSMDHAAERNQLHVVRWLHEHRREGCTTDAMDLAARNGHARVVRYLHDNRSEGCTTGAMDGAATNGYLELVQWLHVNRTEGLDTSGQDKRQ